MTRVQIPAYTLQWMRGNCYGEVIKTYRRFRQDRQAGQLR